jgi:histidinol-phosphate aminotransferase
MINEITRRQWMIGTSAIAGGVMFGQSALSQDRMNMGEPVSKDNPIRYTNNENPYGINPKAMSVIIEAYKKAHLYNFTIRDELTKVIATMENLPPECVLSGAGSGEFLMSTGVICGLTGGNVVAPNPTFGSVTRYVRNFGGKVINVPVDDDLSINLDSMRKAVTNETTLVYLCNPNNPIPSIIEKNTLEQFCLEMSKKAMVVVDEAYYEYARDKNYSTMAHLVKDNPNIVILRTASKIHGFASVRIGFAFAHPDTLKKLARFTSGTTSYPAMMGAITSYQDKEYQKFIIDKNYESLEIIYEMFNELDLPYIKSNANFTYFNAGRDATEVRDKLLESGVLVGRKYEPFPNWVRVSTAKPEEMNYLVDVYKKDFG